MKEYKVTRYSFNELSEEGQGKAIERYCQLAAEFAPLDLVALTMKDKLEELLTGEVTQVQLKELTLPEWDLDRRELSIVGYVTREEAPLLQWPIEADYMRLTHDYYGQHFALFNSEGDEVDKSEALVDQLNTIKRAILRAGQADYDYLSGPELARERLSEEGGEEYLLDGTYAPVIGESVLSNA